MTLRKGHGSGKNALVRVEVLPADEQPAGVPALPVHIERRSDGTVADKASAKALGRKGGLRRAENARMLAGLGVKKPPKSSPLAPYFAEAERALRAQIEALALQAGGHVGPDAASALSTAVMQKAVECWLYDAGAQQGDLDLFKQARAFGDASRQNMLGARELAVRGAEARRDAERNGYTGPDIFEVFADWEDAKDLGQLEVDLKAKIRSNSG